MSVWLLHCTCVCAWVAVRSACTHVLVVAALATAKPVRLPHALRRVIPNLRAFCLCTRPLCPALCADPPPSQFLPPRSQGAGAKLGQQVVEGLGGSSAAAGSEKEHVAAGGGAPLTALQLAAGLQAAAGGSSRRDQENVQPPLAHSKAPNVLGVRAAPAPLRPSLAGAPAAAAPPPAPAGPLAVLVAHTSAAAAAGPSAVRELVEASGTGCADALNLGQKLRGSAKGSWRTR